MTLKVIGAGLGRTGTKSLKAALEMLGFAKCHHMTEVIENPRQAPMFLAAAHGEPVEWDKVYEGYQSCCDWPSCHFWRTLADYYPDAKVILSLRSAESWYKSMNETILASMRQVISEFNHPMMDMGREIILKQAFSNNIEDKNHVIGVFERHNQAVRDGIAPGRLLEFEAKDGWEPLCDFLGIPVPDEPYPNTNDRAEFNQIVQDMKTRISP